MINLDDQKETFEKLSPIGKYKYLEKMRSLLRDIQKLSYRITQFDKKFPFEISTPNDYESLLNAYLDFFMEIQEMAFFVREDEYRNKSY